MALRAVYANSTGSNVDISSRIRAYQLSVSQYAEEESTAITQLMVDDPEGGINILGLRTITISETAESSNQQVIGKWFTTDRDITRGESLRTSSARVWHVNMADPNSIVQRRIMRGSDANRPAETDVARMQWLMSTSELGNTVTTSRYLSTRFPVAMDAVDYRDQNVSSITDDCRQASGKNSFVFWDEPVAAYGMFYDFPGSSSFRSALRLTNVLGFVDNDITFGVINGDTKLNRDPGRVYSGVLLPFVGGEVYVQNDTTAAAFYRRDTSAPSVNVKTTAKATTRANRYLTTIRTEADVITTSFLSPLSHVNHLQVGQAVQCWFSHFPGYDTGWNWMRVMTRSVTAVSEEFYVVEVELAAEVGGLDDGSGTTYPPVPISSPVGAQSCVAARNHLTYNYTGAGTRASLGPVVPFLVGADTHYSVISTDFLQYGSTSSGMSEYPDGGNTFEDLGNGGVNNCVLSAGGTDFFPASASGRVRITVCGPGALSVITEAHPSGPCSPGGTVTATAYVSGTINVVASASGAPGTTFNLTIPNDGECTHFIDFANTTGGWGFHSATWTPA